MKILKEINDLVLNIIRRWKSNSEKALWIVCLILGIPIWEGKLKEVSTIQKKWLREKVTVINEESLQDLTYWNMVKQCLEVEMIIYWYLRNVNNERISFSKNIGTVGIIRDIRMNF